MSNVFFSVFLVFSAGVFIALQAPINSRLGDFMGGPVAAAFISFLTGMIGLGLFMLLTKQSINLSEILNTAPWMWIGGLLGAYLVASTIFAVPVLGAGLMVACLIAGQLAASLIIDHFGILLPEARPITPGRLAGALCLLAGVILIKYF